MKFELWPIIARKEICESLMTNHLCIVCQQLLTSDWFALRFILAKLRVGNLNLVWQIGPQGLPSPAVYRHPPWAPGWTVELEETEFLDKIIEPRAVLRAVSPPPPNRDVQLYRIPSEVSWLTVGESRLLIVYINPPKMPAVMCNRKVGDNGLLKCTCVDSTTVRSRSRTVWCHNPLHNKWLPCEIYSSATISRWKWEG